jgi:hypothetical protein
MFGVDKSLEGGMSFTYLITEELSEVIKYDKRVIREKLKDSLKFNSLPNPKKAAQQSLKQER